MGAQFIVFVEWRGVELPYNRVLAPFGVWPKEAKSVGSCSVPRDQRRDPLTREKGHPSSAQGKNCTRAPGGECRGAGFELFVVALGSRTESPPRLTQRLFSPTLPRGEKRIDRVILSSGFMFF